MIPYSRQSLDEADIEAVVAVLRSPIIARGPKIAEFEEAVAAKVGARFAVAFSSGTAALHGAYFAAGIGPGDAIVTTPLTFAATANAALWQGARVVFADIDPDSGNIDPAAVADKIGARTKAIAAVDYGGLPADLDALRGIAERRGLALIEDATHALGARHRGRPVGSIADISVFSFHPVKPVTAGEAGIATTDSAALRDRLLLFRNHGMTRNPELWESKGAPAYHYEMLELGLNYWLTDFQAALGLSQLRRLDSFRDRRAALAERYRQLFAGTAHFVLPAADKDGTCSGWHLYAVRLAAAADTGIEATRARRDAAFAELRAAGIGAQVHYIPVYWHPYWRKLGYERGLCPEAERFFAAEISLPLYPGLTSAEQSFVAATLRAILDRPG